jgi:cobalt-precorrin 5A hydrolase/precorrin-3B C17-methyltransferase
MSMASAKCGAILGHDFCALSLSDLLTPKSTILSRVQHAAQGDFVTAFYNPQSLTRQELLPQALDILRAHRHPNTPVILARNLTRTDEVIAQYPLESFDSSKVDMLSIVIVGNSHSQTLPPIPSMPCPVYTPRGYSVK